MKSKSSYTLGGSHQPTSEFASTNQLATNGEQLSKSEEALGEYDPFSHRKVNKPTSDMGALAHLLKSSLGSGILAMPRAFLNGGLYFGLIGTLVVGLICTHCVQILVDSSHVLCRRLKKPLMTFSDTAQYAFESGHPSLRKFASSASLSTKAMLVLTYLMGCTVYIVLMATTVNKILHHYDISLNDLVHPNSTDSNAAVQFLNITTTAAPPEDPSENVTEKRILIAGLWIPLLLLTTIRPLKWLVPFSVIANLCITVVFGITLYFVFNEIRSPSELPGVGEVANMPLFFSTVIFAMEGIGVVMPLENQMKTPQHFTGCPGVLNIGMSVVITLYALLGFFGYLRFGDKIKATITLNLLDDYPEDVLAQVVQYLIAVAIFFTYALQFYVPTSIIWAEVKPRIEKSKHTLYHYMIRFVLVTGTVVLAIAVPNLGPIIDLVGAVCFSILGLLLPAIIDTVTRWDGEGNSNFGGANWILYKNFLILIFATLALLAGTYSSIIEIIDTY